MPFCCIAIVGIAILYFVFLSIRQLLLGTWPDKQASKLPAPPRAITGNGAQPVYGHTGLFTKYGGDLAYMFPPDMLEWWWLPAFVSRKLGDCFSVFIWGQWRVVVKGKERTERVLSCPEIKEGWAWTPPVTLLGKNCVCLLEEDEADFVKSLLAAPLSQRSVVRLAPEFAENAETFVDDLMAGKFQRPRKASDHEIKEVDSESLAEEGRFGLDDGSLCSLDTTGRLGRDGAHKIKFSALRSYTFDLIDGPVLGMKRWSKVSEQMNGEGTSQTASTAVPEKEKKKSETPERKMMLLWMERVKAAMCVIKITFGAEWMYIWMLNEYGRAVIGRKHLMKVMSTHVAERSKQVPVQRDAGHSYREPALTNFPLATLAENVMHRNDNVFGYSGSSLGSTRPRSRSDGCLIEASDTFPTGWNDSDVPPPPPFDGTPSPAPPGSFKGNRRRSESSPQVLETSRKSLSSATESKEKKPARSVLDNFLRQKDAKGKGMTEAVTTELSLLLWMIMDAGNAWTAMALNLLSLNQAACAQVQEELDRLVEEYGKDRIFTPGVMKKMTVLDAVLWESIRLCPPFLGGMKVVGTTIELPDVGLQIPKGSNVVFCQPTDGSFNVNAALGKRPEDLGHVYPSTELHGFLPFKGLEVPIMVLQSKVFLAVLLRRCSPFVSKKRTFVRRVKLALPSLKGGVEEKSGDLPEEEESEDIGSSSASSEGKATGAVRGFETTQQEAMRVFTKIPFPEPRRVMHVAERDFH